jgi:hypothetical protein
MKENLWHILRGMGIPLPAAEAVSIIIEKIERERDDEIAKLKKLCVHYAHNGKSWREKTYGIFEATFDDKPFNMIQRVESSESERSCPKDRPDAVWVGRGKSSSVKLDGYRPDWPINDVYDFFWSNEEHVIRMGDKGLMI